MEYKDFIKLVDQTSNYFNWRLGKSLMIVLNAISIEQYNRLLESGLDCYDNDQLITETLNFLKDNWKN